MNQVYPFMVCHVIKNLLMNTSMTMEQNILTQFEMLRINRVSSFEDFAPELLKLAVKDRLKDSVTTAEFRRAISISGDNSRYTAFINFYRLYARNVAYHMQVSKVPSNPTKDLLYDMISKISKAWTDIDTKFDTNESIETAKKFLGELQNIATEMKLTKVLPHFPSNIQRPFAYTLPGSATLLPGSATLLPESAGQLRIPSLENLLAFKY